jgi:hypothetical protein
MRHFSILALCAAAVMGCSTDGSSSAKCTAGAVPTVAMVQPPKFACHVGYTAQFTLANPSCTDVTITSFELTGAITHSPSAAETCSPANAAQLSASQLKTSKVLAGNTIEVLDFTGGPFCCIAPGPCPADFVCNETFTATFHTSAGDLTANTPAELDLQSCTEVCPGT